MEHSVATEQNGDDNKEKIFRLNQELKHLKSLTCRYRSMSDYCEPEYCICSKIQRIESQIHELTKPFSL